MRYVRPVQNAMTKVIAMARGAFFEGCFQSVHAHESSRISKTYVGHLFRNMRHTIEAAKRVQRIHQASDEANGIVVPPSRVDPSPENKFRIAVCRGARNDSDQHNEPADL